MVVSCASNSVEEVIEDARRITSKAEKKGNYAAALQGLRTVTHSLELLGRVTGELRAEGGGLHLHKHLHTSATEPSTMGDADLELSIARDVAAVTDNFNPSEIERLKSLLAFLQTLQALPTADGVLIET